MNQIIHKKIATVILILSLVLPMSGFASFTRAGEVSGDSNFNLAITATTVLRIHVVTANSYASAVQVFSRTAANDSTCLSNAGYQSYVGVQDPSVVNLNQPANCFSLRVGSPIAAPQISVLPLQGMNPIVVVVTFPSAAISAAHIVPHEGGGKLNFAILVFAAVIGTLYESRNKTVKKVNIVKPKQYAYRYSLAELSVFRC